MDTKEILAIAEQDDFAITEVITILQFSQILDRDYNLREKHRESLLIDLWNSIPNKKLCLLLYTAQIKRNLRRKR